MGIKITGGGNLADDFLRKARAALEETMAKAVAERMREEGIDDASRVNITVESDSEDQRMKADLDRVQMLAQQYYDADR